MFKFDQISQYMYAMNVPEDTRKRVKEWCQYTWKTQKSFDELGILENLPVKMRTDVALDIHYQTLKEVKLFHGCDPGLIKELVVKLQPIIFLSGMNYWRGQRLKLTLNIALFIVLQAITFARRVTWVRRCSSLPSVRSRL